MKDYIDNILASRLQRDGGWVEFVSQEDVLTLLRRSMRPEKWTTCTEVIRATSN